MNSIWISIHATNPELNSYGEYEFHSIVNNAPAYRSARNTYLAYDESNKWYIMSEERFMDGISGGWFRIDSKGILKNFNIKKDFNRTKSIIVASTMAGS